LDRVHGIGSRYATSAWSDYAVAACSGEDAAAGLAAAQRIADIRAGTLAPNDWHLSASQTNIGLCLMRLKRFAQAEPLLVKAAAELEASRGPGFYTTQLSYKVLRDLYMATDRAREAAGWAAKIQP